MGKKNTIQILGATLSVAMGLSAASVCRFVNADDMTKPVEAIQPSLPEDVVMLQAIFMDVQGKVRWRTSESSPWNVAKVNDLLESGAEIRTGLKSRSTLRVGKNSTILVDAGTSFQLPIMVQEGQVLRTLATVKSGRADFKVDHVGFSNDFKVVTPQTTLAVRGTGFGLESGPLKGVALSGVNTNSINAIEVTYISSNLSYFVSGQGKTSSETGKQDPVQNAWVSTIGPPPIAGTLVSSSDVDQQVAQGVAGVNPSSNTQQIQQTQAGENNQNAINDAIALSSTNIFATGGNISSLTYGSVQNASTSNETLHLFNRNFAIYESGAWTNSLFNLNTLWNGTDSDYSDRHNSFASLPNVIRNGIQWELQAMKNSAQIDLAKSNEQYAAMRFDPTLYFTTNGDITEVGKRDGSLLNGLENSLWSLDQDATTRLARAGEYNATIQSALGNVTNAYTSLHNAEIALQDLNRGKIQSVVYTAELKLALRQMNTFLSNLGGLIENNKDTHAQVVYSKLSDFVAMASDKVAQGLAAAKNARDNYTNASSRGTQEMFRTQELHYLEAVRIGLHSMAYLTNSAENGPKGILELAQKISDNFTMANSRFSYESFVNNAKPFVDISQVRSGAIQTLADLSMSNSREALDQLADGSINKNLIDAQLSIMQEQVELMGRKADMVYVDGSDDNSIKTGMAGFELRSLTDLTSSNLHKSQFDNLADNGSTQAGLDFDLGALREFNSLYAGANSVQQQAQSTMDAIDLNQTNAEMANLTINGLSASYHTNLNNALAKASDATTSFNQQFSNSQAAGIQYLRDFTNTVGSNTTATAQNALASVTALVGEHNLYVSQAQSAVEAAQNASANASSRGRMVYMNAVATQMSRAANIHSAATLALLHVISNGSLIQTNYNQAQERYNSLGGPLD